MSGPTSPTAIEQLAQNGVSFVGALHGARWCIVCWCIASSSWGPPSCNRVWWVTYFSKPRRAVFDAACLARTLKAFKRKAHVPSPAASAATAMSTQEDALTLQRCPTSVSRLSQIEIEPNGFERQIEIESISAAYPSIYRLIYVSHACRIKNQVGPGPMGIRRPPWWPHGGSTSRASQWADQQRTNGVNINGVIANILLVDRRYIWVFPSSLCTSAFLSIHE